jgi:2',3'-cyclic-nucleotide 2'-phosphodiesterase (5'-nucleotidase family)
MIARALPLLTLAACAKPPPPALEGARSELIVEGKLKDRVSAAPADAVIYYAGEHQGSMETCGCPKRPRGSLPRLASYLEASRAASPGVPDVLVHGGYWFEDSMGFDGALREDVPLMNAWMLQGMEAVGVDAANLSFQDLPGVLELDALPPWVVSANVTAVGDAPTPARFVVIERGDMKIAVTGITDVGMTFILTPQYVVGDPVAGALAALEEMAGAADVLVLLAFQSAAAAREIAEQSDALDVVVDTSMHREFYEPLTVNRAVWVRSHYQTMRLGELRLGVDDGHVTGAFDRKIDLDPEVPDDPALKKMMREAREALEVVQAEIYQ